MAWRAYKLKIQVKKLQPQARTDAKTKGLQPNANNNGLLATSNNRGVSRRGNAPPRGRTTQY